jgi:hypothetical protein
MALRIPSLHVVPLVTALCLTCLPTDAAAQRDLFTPPIEPRHVDVSGSVGFRLSTDWSDLVLLGSVSPVTGAFEQVLARDLIVVPGTVFDATVMYWEGRYGFRAHGGYSQSCLAVGRHCGPIGNLAGAPGSSVDVTIASYDVGGAIGLIDYKRNLWVWPYFFAGLGGITYDLSQSVGPPLGMFIERSRSGSPDRQIVLARDRTDVIAIDELGLESKLTLNFGIGTDFRVPLGPAGVGLRFEASDYVHQSPLNIRVADVDAVNRGAEGRISFGAVHNFRASAGVVVRFGR